jgi:hypothetical protein
MAYETVTSAPMVMALLLVALMSAPRSDSATSVADSVTAGVVVAEELVLEDAGASPAAVFRVSDVTGLSLIFFEQHHKRGLQLNCSESGASSISLRGEDGRIVTTMSVVDSTVGSMISCRNTQDTGSVGFAFVGRSAPIMNVSGARMAGSIEILTSDEALAGLNVSDKRNGAAVSLAYSKDGSALSLFGAQHRLKSAIGVAVGSDASMIFYDDLRRPVVNITLPAGRDPAIKFFNHELRRVRTIR